MGDILGFSRFDLTDSRVGRDNSSEGALGGGTATRGSLVSEDWRRVRGGEHGGSSANRVLVL